VNAEGPVLPLLARTSLAEATADLLRERIIQGSFEPGARLVEVEIARQLGISRAPVREALAMLRAEGLARDEPGRGTYVTVLDRRDVEDVYQVRAAIESGAARLVIEQDDPQSYAALEAALDAMREAAARGDRRAFIEADLSLHGVLCSRSGNDRLYRMWETQTGLMRALIRLETERLVSTFGPILEEHENLVAEIRSGDPDRATAAAWSLFKRTSQVLADGLEAPEPEESSPSVPVGARIAIGDPAG
jgi:DNA-binding GntR family transcriptional regulator